MHESEISNLWCDLQEESDGEDTFISFTTTESKCETLFQRGLELKVDGEFVNALDCFQECLGGMQECQYFAKLPQTLQQLEYLYRALGLDDKAEEYGRAEKLFQEATQLKVDTPSGQTQPKTKRRPFSKKPRSLASSSQGCNPGEYGNLITKKANEFDKLARFCAERGEIEHALEYCGKVVVLRQCLCGESLPVTEASLNYFKALYAELEERKGNMAAMETDKAVTNHVKGDLSTSTASEDKTYGVSGDLSIAADCSSTDCDVLVRSERMWSTEQDTRSQYQANSTTEPQTNGTSVTNCRHHREFKDITVSQQVHTFSGENKGNKGPYFPNGAGGTQECIVSSSELCSKGGHHHPHNGNLCTGMTNLTKLSAELEAPMCVTVNIQTVGTETGMKHPRCLPLWVLLLGAFVEMTLLAYMLYYH